MTPRAWVNRTTGDLLGNHQISWGHDPNDWEPLYTLDQMRECVPACADPGWHGFLYAEGWNDCRDMSLNALDALMKGAALLVREWMRRGDDVRMLERFAREAREDARLGGDE